MRTLRDFILPMTLALVLVPIARAADDEKTATDKKGNEQTVRGVISEVTVLGETDIDFATRKAVTAEATYLTIIGHPAHHDAMHKDAAKAREQASADKEKDAKEASSSSAHDKKSAGNTRHRMNVYVVAVSPRTKVCEMTETGKEGSESIKEEKCDLDKLEIGDRVEVSFHPKEMARKAATHPANQKHGRHRMVFGTATAIKLLPEHMDSEHAHSAEHKDTDNDKPKDKK